MGGRVGVRGEEGERERERERDTVYVLEYFNRLV